MIEKNNTAITKYRSALEIDPKHVSAQIGLGIAYSEQGNLDDAITAGKKLSN